MLDPSEPRFTASTACAVAEVPATTLRSWRNLNGLLKSEAKGWNRFSFNDLCTVRVVAILARFGFSADRAVRVSSICSQAFLMLNAGHEWSQFANVTPTGVVFLPAGSKIEDSHGDGEYVECGILLDFETIRTTVARQINALGGEQILSEQETRNLVFGAMAKALEDKGGRGSDGEE